MSDKDFNIKEHFKVPEGYFDNLTAQIMANIPEQEKAEPTITVTGRKSRMSYYAACAASIAASLLILVVATISHQKAQDDTHMAETVTGNSVEQYAYTVDEAADYAMLDNQDIYEMIAE